MLSGVFVLNKSNKLSYIFIFKKGIIDKILAKDKK